MNKQKIKPIDANTLQKRLESIYNSILVLYHDGYEYGEKDGIAECILELQSMPIIDLENLKPLGKWIDDGDYITIAHGHLDVKTCSVCGEKISIYDFDNYCPNCGTRME